MKKKLFAVLSIVLIVVLACSMAACKSKTMFDGEFKKEASQEDAKSMWDSAYESMGGYSVLAASASDENELVKGWKGLKMSAANKMEISSVENGETEKMSVDAKTSGTILFDGSAMAITGYSNMTNVDGGKTTNVNVDAGIYAKDKKAYFNMGLGENSLKFKFDQDQSDTDGFLALGTMISSIYTQFTTMAVSTISSFVCELSYDEIVRDYGKDFKAYINDNGDYIRIKYAFTPEMLYDMSSGLDNEFYDEFLKNAKFDECSVILVADKETNSFQGAKLSINYGFDFKDAAAGESFSMKINTSASIENCDKVESMPSNFNDYKDLKDISLEDLNKFLEGLPF